MNFKKLLVILATVMLLISLTGTASAAEVGTDTTSAAAAV